MRQESSATAAVLGDPIPVKSFNLSEESRENKLKQTVPIFPAPVRGELGERNVPSDPSERVDTLAQFIWAQACTGKFVWPIADRGFKKPIHRIAAPTLIIWGKADRIVAPKYAQEFAQRIAGARVDLIDSAGHLPQLEQPEAVAKAIRGFLGG
jgi:pimeloyl-ACP methyl ester carboxylesterase